MKNSNIEIERKFLIYENLLPKLPDGEVIYQGYLSTIATRVVRVRTKGQKAFLAIKGEGTIKRAEFEYEIPFEDAQSILKMCEYKIEKVRYKIPSTGNLVWEIDEFKGKFKGFWLAEIELTDTEQSFEKPSWLRKEVTSDKRYMNSNMAWMGEIPIE